MAALTPLAPEYPVNEGRVEGSDRERLRALLEPDRLPDHLDALYRAACAMCGSRHDAEDPVQETFARVLKRPRLVRRDHELGYLLRALRNSYYSHYRAAARRPATIALVEAVASAAPQGGFRADASRGRSGARRPSFATRSSLLTSSA
jgi:DNA-directed RNA polymerase specialized sigma24 family protein